VDKEDKFRHSKWLSFMHKRLELAKNLLTDDGVIFISIDDNEQGNLRVLCDEIFGENNFINNITVKSSEVSGVKMSHTSNRLPKIKEYLLCYACSKQLLILNALKIQKSDDDKQLNKYLKYYSKIITNFEDDVNNWNILPLQKYFSDNELKLDKEEIKNFKIYNAHRVIYRTNNKAFKNLDIKEGLQEIISSTGLKYICWEGKQMLFLKDYLEEGLCDLWNDISTINLNKEMTGLKSFENGQKPKELINRVLKLKNKNITVLDFFAGSGTTAHAVLELNQYDGSNRQCILATNNENGICEDITYERVKRVIEGYSTPKGKEVAGLGGALHYLKTDFVPKTDYGAISDKDKINFSHQVGIMLALKENTFNEMKSNDHYQIFTSDEKICGIYFSESLVELDELLDFMLEQDKPCYLYAYPELDEADFAKSNIILSEIPEHILQIYKNIGVVS
jgi:adenine-specific DNA-methyltransferase